MEVTPGNIMRSKLSLAEALAFGSTVAIIMVFAFGNFQSKADAVALERRIEALERQMNSIQHDLSKIGASVEYVRGRLEPKSRE